MESNNKEGRGRLIIVGSGIKGMSQMTLEAKGWIEKAEKVFYLVAEPVTQAWIKRTRPEAINLHHIYAGDKLRTKTYAEMADIIMDQVRAGLTVCCVFYGHPGVFANPPHAALRMARSEGYFAEMLPGISAEDCLFADLGIDPSTHGLQSYEATELLLRNRPLYTGTHVIIWQVGTVGDPGFDPSGKFKHKRVDLLADYLEKNYDADYYIYDYLGSSFPHVDAQIFKIKIKDIRRHTFHVQSTLYIPPTDSVWDEDILKKLNHAQSGIESQNHNSAPAYKNERLPEAKVDSKLAKFLYEVAINPTLGGLFKNGNKNLAALSSIYSQLSDDELLALSKGDYGLTCKEIYSYEE